LTISIKLIDEASFLGVDLGMIGMTRIVVAAAVFQFVFSAQFVFFAAPLAAFAAPDKQQILKGKTCSGYELNQITSLNGKYKTFVSANAVRVDHVSYGYSFVSRAPDWNVSIFRPDTKEYSTLSYQQWMKTNLILVSTVWTMELKKPVSSRHFVQGGQSYVAYRFPSTEVMGGYFRGDHGSDYKALENNKSEITCLEFPADVHAGAVAGRAICLPTLGGTPVLVTRESATVKSWTLKTVSTRRVESMASSLFDVPSGYKKVPFNRTLFSSSTQKEDIDDMFGMGASR
jgi:hypothetical protein